MNEATFDPAQPLTLYFRCARAGTLDFVFLDENGEDYSLIYEDVELNIYKNQGDKKKVISLTPGFGISFPSSGTARATVTDAITNINEGEYYFELYRPDLGKTWICGDAVFHNGKFDGINSSSTSVTIYENGSNIVIYITGESGMAIQFQNGGVDLGNNQADTLNFSGDGVTASRVGNTVTVEIPGSSTDAIFYKNSTSISITGTVAETIIDSILIPANTFEASDIIKIVNVFSKSGTAGTLTSRVKVNDTNSLIGATTICSFAPVASASWIKTSREMIFKNDISSQVVFGSTNTGNPNDVAGTAVTITSLSTDYSTDKYIILSAQNGNSGDTSTLQSWYIQIIR